MFFLIFPSFLLLWSAVIIMYPTTLAVIALTFSNYILQPVFPHCAPPYMATRMLSTTCLREWDHNRTALDGCSEEKIRTDVDNVAFLFASKYKV